MDRAPVPITPKALENVFAAQYYLSSLTYINGVTIEDDVASKERAIRDLERAKAYCHRALEDLQ